jgi:hypothetical protein
MIYPPMPVMLVVDPTEAIHSELIVPTFERYFTPEQFTPLGGAIAYLLLTHNERFFAAEDGPERERWIEEILDADDRFLSEHPESTLFAYFAGRPTKSVLEQGELLARWEAEEVEREQRAESRGGEYYERGPLAATLIALDERRAQTAAVNARVVQLEAELTAMRSRRSYAYSRRAVESRWVAALRRRTAIAGLERRLRS